MSKLDLAMDPGFTSVVPDECMFSPSFAFVRESFSGKELPVVCPGFFFLDSIVTVSWAITQVIAERASLHLRQIVPVVNPS